MASENKFGFAEVVDTFSDVINAVTAFIATVSGGFNLLKFLQFALAEYPNLQEVVEDFDTFLKELADLTPQEALDAVGQIDARTDGPVADGIVNVLKVAAVSYDYIDKTLNGARRILQMVKDLF